jgi:protein O-GlcNAc transferase
MSPEAAPKIPGSDNSAGGLANLETAPLDPLDSKQLLVTGVTQLANNCADKALPALRAAVALGETAPTTLLNLALAEHQAGDPEAGLRRMRDLECSMREWDEPPLRLAEAARAVGRMEEAEAAYRRVLAINPRREAALLGLAGLLLMRGEANSARDLLLRCCGIAPQRADAWDTLGIALHWASDSDLAESAFARAQELAPKVLEYALHRVEAAWAAHEGEALLASLDIAGKEDPLNPVPLAARGLLLERQGRRAEAADALEAAAALAPDSPLPTYLLGEVLARCNRLSEAEATLRRASELDPTNERLRNTRAAVLFRMHRHAEARSELLRSIEQHGENVTELCNLANATTCLGLQKEGVTSARRAIELAPEATAPWRTLCNTLPYQDGITGQELLAALRACSDRLPRESPPSSPIAPTQSAPWSSGYCRVRSESIQSAG